MSAKELDAINEESEEKEQQLEIEGRGAKEELKEHGLGSKETNAITLAKEFNVPNTFLIVIA